jgi:hypothetical protein
MTEILIEWAIGAIFLSLFAFMSAKLSRPLFKTRASKVISQTLASIFLFLGFSFSKSLEKSSMINDFDSYISDVLVIFAVIISLKFSGMYLISCYARSVEKSPYWSFIALLNFMIALPVLIFSLWKGKSTQSESESISG